MKKLKIGVLTFHRCINYGSYWQAKCLVEGLQQRGHDAVILDHESCQVNLAEWKCAYQPVLPTPVPPKDWPLYRKKIQGFFQAFESLPLSPRFPLHDPGQMEDYDLVVVGSDEVWNLYHPWYGKFPIFYGENIKAKTLVAYAASFGNFSSPLPLDAGRQQQLQRFEHISVRDENSQTILRRTLGFTPAVVLDPCLQFEQESLPTTPPVFNKPYAAVYGHNFSPVFIRNARAWAAHRDLPLISIGYRNDWADEQWLTADPYDFASFISGTVALVTNFFHGCVFALRNATPFVCEPSPYRSNKLQGLMKKIGGNKYLLGQETPEGTYRERLNQPVDEAVLTQISLLRQSSDLFLDKALTTHQHAHAKAC